jgi:hypothetical protein
MTISITNVKNAIILKETTTPTAKSGYGRIYTKTDNNLYFQDGAGVEHEIGQTDTHYAEMYEYEGSTSVTINVANQYHAVFGIFGQDHLNNFTFTAGIEGSGNITTAASGTAININDAAHGLSTDEIIQVQSANHTGTVVVTKVDVDNFTVPITYVGNEAGYWQRGDRLEAGTGSAGTYRFAYNMSLTSDGNGKTYKFELSKNTTHIDESACERKIGTGADIGAMGANGLISIADGDVITLLVENPNDTTDLTLKHSNVSLNRL